MFTPKPGTMLELKTRIKEEVDILGPDMVNRACIEMCLKGLPEVD
jgi:hypothetical protein